MDKQLSVGLKNENVRPTTAMVIAVGSFAIWSAGQVRKIYLQGDARRAAACTFYQLMPDDTDGLALAELENICRIVPDQSPDFLKQRQASLRNAVKHSAE